MDPCRGVNCLSNAMRRRNINVTTTTVVNPSSDQNDNDRATNFFSIMLPIILVIGVFIAVGTGLVVHRLILKFLQKRWNSRSSSGNNGTSGGIEGGYYSRNGLNTVSGNLSDLPTYGQVMLTIQTEERPPSYYEISGGVTNLGFTSDGNLHITIQSPRQDEDQIVNSSTNGEDVEENPPPDFSSQEIFPSSSNPDGSYCYRNRLPPMEEPEIIIKQDIEDVINSISVPSILSDVETESDNNTVKNKEKTAKRKHSKQSNANLASKTSVNMESRNTSIILTSTVL